MRWAGVLIAGSLLLGGIVLADDDAGHYFPRDYDQSRAIFRHACVNTPGCVTDSFAVTYPAPSGQDLTIDTAYIATGEGAADSPRNQRLVILQSGIHGPEAFGGAAVQRLVFEKHLPKLRQAGIDVLMIHAVNPWGFKNLRRVDGNNVDLNRNFSPGDPSLPYSHVNKDYESLSYLAELQEPVGSVWWQSFLLDIRTFLAYAGHGFDPAYIGDGLHAGQYAAPDGFEFGGRAPAQQTRFWTERIQPIMARYTGEIVFLDLHTGLGPADTLTVFSGNGWPPARVAAFRAFVEETGDPGIRMQAPTESSYQSSGDVIDFVPGLRPAAPVTAVTLEWGTLGEGTIASLVSNTRMILEHQAHFHGCTTASVCEEVHRNFVDMFNPDDATFRTSLIRETDAFLSHLETAPLVRDGE
jgi:Protein of unknown function (DUF2817)